MSEDLKRCSNCKIEKLLIVFHEDKNKNDEINFSCTRCRKFYFSLNQIRLKFCQKNYSEQTKETRNLYFKNRLKSDFNFVYFRTQDLEFIMH